MILLSAELVSAPVCTKTKLVDDSYSGVINCVVYTAPNIAKSTTTKIMTSNYGNLVKFNEYDLNKDLDMIKEVD